MEGVKAAKFTLLGFCSAGKLLFMPGRGWGRKTMILDNGYKIVAQI